MGCFKLYFPEHLYLGEAHGLRLDCVLRNQFLFVCFSGVISFLKI